MQQSSGESLEVQDSALLIERLAEPHADPDNVDSIYISCKTVHQFVLIEWKNLHLKLCSDFNYSLIVQL
jgi:hypothetical protein